MAMSVAAEGFMGSMSLWGVVPGAYDWDEVGGRWTKREIPQLQGGC